MATTRNKVMWQEGMLMRPHHFQQQQRSLKLKQAEALARTLLGRAKLLESKNNPFNGGDK